MAGDRAGSRRLFEEALGPALEACEEEVANHLCWLGSVNEFAATVMRACEQAVELAPNARKGLWKDLRGLARALTGDTAGAIADFAALVEYVRQIGARTGLKRSRTAAIHSTTSNCSEN